MITISVKNCTKCGQEKGVVANNGGTIT